MEFSPFQVSYAGNGMVIGFNAIVHVPISHGVAIGVLFLIALGEWRLASLPPGATAEQWRHYQKKLLRFAAYTVTVFGSITGAGIWFTSPRSRPLFISSLFPCISCNAQYLQ